MKEREQIISKEKGQAMVEFAIMLIIFMAVISGMIYMFRLLLFDYWAQQEARLLAFEQTWVPQMYYDGSGENPQQLIANGARLKRPELVSSLTANKSADDDGSISDILPSLAFSPKQKRQFDVLYANRESGSLIEEAFAAKVLPESQESVKVEKTQLVPVAPGLDQAIIKVLSQAEVGKRVCESFRSVAERYQFRLNTTPFGDARCAERVDGGFGAHLAANVDLPQLWRDYGALLDDGVERGEGIKQVVNQVVAEQFYSFFDTQVNLASNGAVPYIVGKRFDASQSWLSGDVTRMVSDMRYLGSSAALIALGAKMAEVVLQNPGSTDAAEQREFEQSVLDILHVDASDVLPVIGNGFLLSPFYLPVPPTMGAGAGGLFNGAARNVFSEETELFDPLIDNSNKEIVVTYDSAGGLFPAAIRRFKTGARLTSRFYLVTQPWHITRRKDINSDYRDKGTQFDDMDDETEEGMLRRRTLGFWLFPSRPGALIEPITDLIGLDALDGIMSIVSGLDSVIATIKSFLADNPLFELFNILSEIPVFGGIFPTVPRWPTVRPDAYPGSVEMEGDRMAGEERNFQDYVDEQREYNPEPEPDYN